MTKLEKVRHNAKAHTTRGRDGVFRLMSALSSSPTRRIFLATVAAVGACGLVLPAASSYAQSQYCGHEQKFERYSSYNGRFFRHRRDLCRSVGTSRA